MSKSNQMCETLFDQANVAGIAAADEVELPEIKIVETDSFGNLKPDAKQYTMMGMCGFAVIHFPAVTKFAKWMVMEGNARKDSYYGGLRMNVGAFGQSVDKKEAFAYAFAGVLLENGIKKVWVESRLD